MKKWASVLLILSVLIVAACGGGDEPAAEDAPTAQEAVAATLAIAMNDLYYGDTPDNMNNPPVWTVNAGETVQLDFDNKGLLQHNWALVKPNTDIPIPFDATTHVEIILWEAGLVEPATQLSETFTAPEAGEYVVICTVAGHYPAMQGRLVVQ